jgi:hypothetical protein
MTPTPQAIPAFLTPATELPELVVDEGNLPETAKVLAKFLASSPNLFEQDGDIIKIIRTDQGISTVPLNAHSVVNEAHDVCRPIVHETNGGGMVKVPVTLPQRVASLC